MRCYRIKIKNNAEWFSDGTILIENMVFADDFLTAVIKGQEVLTSVLERLEIIMKGDRLGKDLESLRLQEVIEICSDVVDGVGHFGDRHSLESVVDSLVKRLEKRKTIND
jgi:hypothetical protein